MNYTINSANQPIALIDATSADAVAPLYLSGHFNAAALSFADGTVAADVADKARELGIYIA